MHKSNRKSEAKFRAMLGDSVELFGIDLQMNFARSKPDPNECSSNTILFDLHTEDRPASCTVAKARCTRLAISRSL